MYRKLAFVKKKQILRSRSHFDSLLEILRIVVGARKRAKNRERERE